MWAVPFLILAGATMRMGRWREAALWSFVACLCREEIPLLVASLASLEAWRHRAATSLRDNPGVRLAAAALLFMAVVGVLRENSTFYVEPREWMGALLRGEGVEAHDGMNSLDLLPARLSWLATWLVGGAAACLLAPEVLLASAPMALYLFRETHPWATWQSFFSHHGTLFIPFVALAAVVGWGRVKRWANGRLSGGAGGKGAQLLGFGSLALLLGLAAIDLRAKTVEHTLPEIAPWREQRPDLVKLREWAELIPLEDPVLTDYWSIVRFSGRQYLYCYEQSPDMILGEAPPPPEGPLHPRSPIPTQWIVLGAGFDGWQSRGLAAGLVVRERFDSETGNYLLLGPPLE
jgi:hypothetical protein